MITKRTVLACIAALTIFATGLAQTTERSPVPSDEAIRTLLAQRIDTLRQGVGIVVGVLEPNGRRIISHGKLAKGDERPLTGDTLFEIGSVTKVFSALLLADMVVRGEVALDDPITRYLPAEVRVPERGRAITLADLATHTSGLPRLPDNMGMVDQANPYADYTVAQLYEFLANYSLPRDVGSQYEYSNLGGGLLGHVLARVAGTDYEALVRTRITDPLGMPDTRIDLPASLQSRLAIGHDARLVPVPNWDLPTLAGAGALRSSANDLLDFLAAHLDAASPLARASALMLSVRRPTPSPNIEIALGWHIIKREGSDIIWHNGGTGGYRSFVGYDPAARVGVVLLSNTSTVVGVDDIGRHLLDPRMPLLPADSPLLQPPKDRTAITVSPEQLEAHVGRYQFTPNVFLTITRENTQLFAQLTGQPKAEIFPETERDFFFKIVDAQLTFTSDGQPQSSDLVLQQLGRRQRAVRIDGEPLPMWFGRREGRADPAAFDRYVGRYQLAPAAVLAVTREGDRLFVQLTGQPKGEVFAETEQVYFSKNVDAQISFETIDQSPAAAVILRQNGQERRAPRIE